MMGVKVDLKASLDSGKDLGSSSPLESVGLFVSGGLRPLEDLYQKVSSDTNLTSDERVMYEKELLRLFSKFIQADEYYINAHLPEGGDIISPLEFGSDKAEEKINGVLDDAHTNNTIKRNLANAIIGLRDGDAARVKKSCENFRENSINSFIADLRRSHAVIELEDGRVAKIHQVLGYKTYKEMRDASEDQLKNRFVEKFREIGLSDETIANLAMNMSQKSTLAGHAYSAALLIQQNNNYTGPEASNRKEKIIIDHKAKKVKFMSSSNVTMRDMENPVESKSALYSTWSFTLPMGEVSGSKKNFEGIFEHSLGYKVSPIAADTEILVMPDLIPPKLSESLVISGLTLNDLDNMLPMHEAEDFSLVDVRQTFSELFGLQRGARFSKGIEGRMLDIFNKDLQDQGHKKVKSIEGSRVSNIQIGKLVDVLAKEQQIDDADIPKLKFQIIQSVNIRARLSSVGYTKKLDVEIQGPKLRRFGFFGELSRKASQAASVLTAARDIGESMNQSIQKTRAESARGVKNVLPSARGRKR